MYSERLRFAKDSGAKVMEVLAAERRPRDIFTEAAIENALAADAALGCSTNTVLHLAAIATEAGLELDLRRVNDVAARVPHICRLAPAGEHHMEDLYHAGGVQAVMKQLIDAGLMDGSALSVAGGTVGEAVAGARVADSDVIRPLDRAYHATGGLAVLFGNLAPHGAVVKEGAVAPEMLRHSGPARVFDGERDAVAAIAEGVIGAGVVLTSSTVIIDVTGPAPVELRGRIPARSVVIPGTRVKSFPAGDYGVTCALIIGQRKESTDKKTSLNAALRDFAVAV